MIIKEMCLCSVNRIWEGPCQGLCQLLALNMSQFTFLLYILCINFMLCDEIHLSKFPEQCDQETAGDSVIHIHNQEKRV